MLEPRLEGDPRDHQFVELGDSAMDSERVGQEDQQPSILSRCQLSIS